MFVLTTNVITGRTKGTTLFFEWTIGLALSPENGHVDLLVMLGHADLNQGLLPFISQEVGLWELL